MKKLFTLILFLTCFNLNAQSQGINTPGVSIGDNGIRTPAIIIGGGDGIDSPPDNPVTPATTLLEDLKVWWNLSSVNATFSSNNLTNVNTTTFSTGKVGNASYHVRASNQNLSIADNDDVSLGDRDWTIAGWFYLDNITNVQTILSKRNATTSTNNEFTLIFNTTGAKLEFYQFNSGTTANAALQSSGTISATTWYYYIIWHNNTDNKLYMQVNGGTVSEVALTVVPYDGASSFRIGTQQTTNTVSQDGRNDEVAIWHRVLTADERTYLYNSGTGRTYAGGVVQ